MIAQRTKSQPLQRFGEAMEHFLMVIFGKLLEFLGDMIIKLMELFPDHSRERKKKREAKSQLNRGLKLLGKKSVQEADIHFGAALTIQPDIAHVLSKRENRKIRSRLSRYATGPNGTRLLLDLGTVK
jgi:predicted flavoprotein YhiN